MQYTVEDFVNQRTGEPLEERLREQPDFQKLKKELKRRIDILGEHSISWEEIEALENAFAKYCSVYGRRAYLLGYEDGKQIEEEHQIKMKKSVLSLREMKRLINVYDAVKKLEITMLGNSFAHENGDGVLGMLKQVYDVIEAGVCSEIAFKGEEEVYESLIEILENVSLTAENRAKMLTGIA